LTPVRAGGLANLATAIAGSPALWRIADQYPYSDL